MIKLHGRNLSAQRSGVMVFENVNFEVAAGETLIVSGPNGAGKTTLLRIIAGLLVPHDGSVVFERAEKCDDTEPVFHLVLTANGMHPALSVAENLRFWQSYQGNAHESIGVALEKTELEKVRDIPFGYLSTGQRRRVALCRLLISQRPVWLLDEPTSGLDQRAADIFDALLRDHCRSGGLVVAASHLRLGGPDQKRLELGPPA